MSLSLFIIQRKINNGLLIFTSSDFAAISVAIAVPEIAKIKIDSILLDGEPSEASHFGAFTEFLDSVIDEVTHIFRWIFDEWLS